MKIGNKEFDTRNRTYIMGILNTTPDSFYDGGKYNSLWLALTRAEQMVREGAEIVDVGGESTRPGYTQISAQEEIDRTAGLIAQMKARFDVAVSVDTYKAVVARCALEAGADIVNDVWGLKKDPEMAGVIAKSGAACVLGHNRENGEYTDFSTEFDRDMNDMVKAAQDAGISTDRIILDPGIGFAKTAAQSLQCLAGIREMPAGFPVLIGASNKSVIGSVLNLPVGERLTGTLATTAYAVLNGAAFVRVHNIKENCQMIQMLQAIKEAKGARSDV